MKWHTASARADIVFRILLIPCFCLMYLPGSQLVARLVATIVIPWYHGCDSHFCNMYLSQAATKPVATVFIYWYLGYDSMFVAQVFSVSSGLLELVLCWCVWPSGS